MIRKLLFTLFLALIQTVVFGQTLGDYRSKVASGTWTSLSSWEYFNGSSWVQPTGISPQGYPGQFTGTGAVLIQTGNSITIGTGGIATKPMGTVTVTGSLVLTGVNNGGVGTDFVFDTQTIIVTKSVGTITFIDKVNFKLPANATLQVFNDLTVNPDYYGLIGDCNHNQDIYIGLSAYAYCNGGGTTGLTFGEVMTGGGTLNAIITSNSPVCKGSQINLFGSFTGAAGTGLTYTWSIKDPNNNSTTVSTPNVTLSNAIAGTYTVTLTCATTYSSNGYSNSETISVIVNALPSAPLVTSTQPSCLLATGDITVNNPIPASGITYTVVGTSPFVAAVTNMTGIFSSLSVGNYNVTTTNASGCISPGTAVTINAQPIVPAAPSVGTITQPTCAIATGSVVLSGLPATWTATQSGTSSATIPGTGTSTTISGLAAGTYYYTVSNGTCTSTTTSAVTINAQPIVPAAPSVGTITQPTCAIATGSVVLSGLPATWTVTQSGTSSATIPGTGTSTTISGLVAGTYYYTVSNGTCTSTTTSAITINAQPAAPAAPSVGTITQPTCTSSTGSVVLSGLPAGNWTVNPGALSGNSATALVTGLSPGTTYNFTVTTAAGCTSQASANVVINPASITSTWNGSSWSSTPTSADKIIFNGNFSSTADLAGCSCQVNSGDVVINSAHTLTLTNELTVSGGSLTFENNASLVQINNSAINTGNITYKRSNSTSRETDYTYWSSPVAGQVLKNVSIKTPSSFFYSYDAIADDWHYEDPANVMSKGIGYIIRGPHYTSTPPPGFYEAPFIGVPNNGNVSVSIPFAGSETTNLIGNPYPSALDADLFLTANSGVLDGTLYFWTHHTEIGIGVSNPGTGIYAYSSDDYAAYNHTGGIGTGNFIGGLVEQTSNKPSGKIASGQSFLALGIAAGNAVFNNSMRLAGGASGVNNLQFFKMTKNSKTTSAIEKNRVWLNLTNEQGAFKQTLIGYVTNATNKYDNAFDGESVDGNDFIDFYSVNADKSLTIQGRALPFDENDQVPLGYSTTIKGAFSIAIDQVDGLLASQDIFIEDKNTGTIKNLKEGAYSFSTEVGVFNDRFVLRYINTNKNLAIGSFETLDNRVLVSKDKNELKIKSELENIKRITVFDLLGRKVFDKEAIESNEFNISNFTLNKQTVIVKVTLTTGEIISKKVIY